MSPLAEMLRDEIRREGPISFHRFMQAALYDPIHGYYRRARDPFGIHGDFYTAEQIQPVFGILMAARIRALYREMGEPPDFTVVELGAGRDEMAEAFSEWHYIPVDLTEGALPERFRGVVFANEFFDALPVEQVVFRDGAFRELRVGWDDALRLDAWRTRARRSRRLHAALLSAAGGRRGLRDQPGSARMVGAHRPRARSGIRFHHRLRLYARRVRAVHPRNAHELPAALGG